MLDRLANPHHLIKKSQDFDLLKLKLRERYADYANIKDEKDNTLLHHAARIGHVSLILEIIYAGCAVNARTKQKETALWIALKHGHFLAADILLACGASKESAEHAGKLEKTQLQQQDRAPFWLKNNERALNDLKKLYVKSEIVSALLFWQIRHPVKNKNSLFTLIKPQLYNLILDESASSGDQMLIEQMETIFSELILLAREKEYESLARELQFIAGKEIEKRVEKEIKFFDTIEDRVSQIKEAYDHNDFCLLFELFKTLDESRIFSWLIASGNHSLINFWLVSQGKDLYTLAPDLFFTAQNVASLSEANLLGQLVLFCGGKIGLLSHIIDENIKIGIPLTAKLRLFSHLVKYDEAVALDLLMGSLAEQCPFEELLNIKIITENNHFYLLNPPENPYVAQFLKFNMNLLRLEVENLQKLNQPIFSPEILQIVFSYLDPSERSEILDSKNLGPMFHCALRMTQLRPSTQEESTRFRLDEVHLAMANFFEELDQVYVKGYKGYKKTLSVVIFLMTLSLAALELFFLINLIMAKKELDNGLGATHILPPASHKTCLDIYQERHKENFPNEVNFCQIFLTAMNAIDERLSGVILANVTTGFILLVSIKGVFDYFFQLRPGAPKDNFKEMAISNFPHLESSTKAMQIIFAREKKADLPLPGIHSMPDITGLENISDVRKKIEALETYYDHIERMRFDLADKTKDAKIDVSNDALVESEEKTSKKSKGYYPRFHRQSLEIPLLSSENKENRDNKLLGYQSLGK